MAPAPTKRLRVGATSQVQSINKIAAQDVLGGGLARRRLVKLKKYEQTVGEEEAGVK